MRQIAHLGARPVDDLGVALDEEVEFVRHRLNLLRVGALETFRPAFANGGELVLQCAQRSQAEANLHENGDQKAQSQEREHGDKGLAKGGRLRLQLVEIARNQE